MAKNVFGKETPSLKVWRAGQMVAALETLHGLTPGDKVRAKRYLNKLVAKADPLAVKVIRDWYWSAAEDGVGIRQQDKIRLGTKGE